MTPSVHAARVLLRALADLGLRDVVLAPGSRSAPLAYAAAEAAAGAPGAPDLALHVRIDERSAAFCALGIAKAAAATGHPRPVAVVTTSGTAVANLHPAVLEAHHSGLPLLLLTADRPHELRGTGANQTTEQVGLLTPAPVHDVPAPTGRPDEARDLRALAARVVVEATGARTGDPGPVHVNLAFREPLVPDGALWPEPGQVTGVVRRGGVADPAVLAVTGAAEALRSSPGAATEPDGVPTVVVAGDGAGPDARRVAEANDWPLLAEPSSGARSGPNAVPAYRLLLDHAELGGAVQRVVVLGRPTLSRPVQALLARPDVRTLVIAPSGAGWPDATRSADQVVAEVPPVLLRGNLGRGAVGPRGPWLEAWQAAGRAAVAAVRNITAGPTGPGLADALARALGPDDVLVAGSSNPVRDLDLVADWAEAPLVLANRGLAGIDGTIATASGVALALGRRVVAYVGDLTFLHDVGSLVVGPLERRPDLTVVVADDDGGSIFATLEHGGEHLERVFTTPHGVDVAAVCKGLGVPVERVTPTGLAAALRAQDGPGLRAVVVRVDRGGRADLHARLTAAVRDAVGPPEPIG